MSKLAGHAMAALIGFACAGSALAQSYPAKPIRVIVPFAAAGGVDLGTRAITEKMSEILKQPMIIDNRGGGATVIASDLAAKAPADGYTVLIAPTTMVINPSIRSKLPYDWEADFVPVSMMMTLPFVVCASRDFPANNMKELAQLARDKPDSVSFGSGGAGTVAHFAGELFAQRSGVSMIHAAYKGEGPALGDAMGGQISVMFSTLVSASGHLKQGRMKSQPIMRVMAFSLPKLSAARAPSSPGYPFSSTSFMI